MSQLNNQDIEILLQALDHVAVKGVQSMQAVLLVAEKLREMKAEIAKEL